MTRDEAAKVVSDRHNRRIYVDPVKAGLTPAIATMFGLSTIGVLASPVPWWIIVAVPVGIFLCLRHQTEQKNRELSAEIDALLR